jgi:hypothetical protein
MQCPGPGVCHPIRQAIPSRGKSTSFASAYARHTPIYLSIYMFIYILIPPKFDFRPKGTRRPKGSVWEEQARLLLGLLPDSETNARLYIQETGKVRLYIGPAHASPKPPLGYIASSYAHTLRICKPPMSSTNHRLTRAYAGRMLMREKQRVGPSTPSTGSKRRVSISCICLVYANHVHSVARPRRATARSLPPRPPAAKGVSLPCTFSAYAQLMFSTSEQKDNGSSW